MTPELVRLLDRQAIYDCSVRYSRGLDRMDAALFRSAFWEDAVLCNGPVNGPIDDFLAWWWPSQCEREAVQHSISNQYVEFEGSDVAHVETYFIASVKKYGSASVDLLTARYVDRFEKRADRWRIASRLLLSDWVAEVTSSAGSLGGARHRGYRGPADPSYTRPAPNDNRRPTIEGILV